MASLYEQYMTSVSAMDQRREQERQLALQQQAQQLRERALAEQIRAAGVSEAQDAQRLGLMGQDVALRREQFDTEKEYQDYLRSLSKDVTVTTRDGQQLTITATPGQIISGLLPEKEDPYRAYQFRMTRAPIETASVFNQLLGQADFTPEPIQTEVTEAFFPPSGGGMPGIIGSAYRPRPQDTIVETERVPAQRFTEYGSSISSAIRSLRPEQIEAAYVNPASFYTSLGSALRPLPTGSQYTTSRKNVLGMVDRALLDVGLPAFSSLNMSGLTQQQESE
jgi:multidrug efflux pump subunit AcrA (membrane-fusion protein)